MFVKSQTEPASQHQLNLIQNCEVTNNYLVDKNRVSTRACLPGQQGIQIQPGKKLQILQKLQKLQNMIYGKYINNKIKFGYYFLEFSRISNGFGHFW